MSDDRLAYNRLNEDYERLRLDYDAMRRENAALRQMIPLLKGRLNAFFVWFQGTIDGIH